MSKQDRKNAARAVAESAHQIWLAGLGAFAKAQAEGSRLFDQLIEDGTELEKQTRKYTTDKLGELRGRMEQTVERVRNSSQASMARIQAVVDERIAKAVQRMAVPTREDFAELARKVGEINRSVVGAMAPRAGAGPVKSAPAAKKASARKARPARKTPAAAKPATSAKKAAPARKAAKRRPTR